MMLQHRDYDVMYTLKSFNKQITITNACRKRTSVSLHIQSIDISASASSRFSANML